MYWALNAFFVQDESEGETAFTEHDAIRPLKPKTSGGNGGTSETENGTMESIAKILIWTLQLGITTHKVNALS